MKKLILAALFSISAIFTVSAQISRVESFLGNWKMTKIEGEAKSSTIKTLTMSVALDGKELLISQKTQGVEAGKDYAETVNRSYKLNGAVSTEPADGIFEGTLVRYMTFISPDKLMFVLGLRNDATPSNAVAKASVELWTLSEKAKILTVESRTRHTRSKIVFSRQ